MKLAYLINQYPMASLTFIRREVSALEAMGHSVAIFAIQPWPDDLIDEADKLDAAKTRYLKAGGASLLLAAMLVTACTRPGAFWNALRLSVRVKKSSDRSWAFHLAYLAEACLLRKWLAHADIEHLHIHFATNSTEVGMLCRALAGPPYSFTVHGPEEFDRAICQSLGEKVKRAKFVAPVSSFGRSQLYRWIKLGDWGKVAIVRCGLDEHFLAHDVPAPGATNTLVCIGRLCEQKGQVLLIDATAELLRRGVDVNLRLVGDGPMRPDCEAAIVRHGVGKQVTITGWATGEQVRAEMVAARALVLPSFAEGLPVVIMEALAIGRPVVSTFVAGIPELVQPGVNGWLVPPGDVERLADAMQAVLEAPAEKLSQMGQAGRKAVLERHDVRKEAAKLAALFCS